MDVNTVDVGAWNVGRQPVKLWRRLFVMMQRTPREIRLHMVRAACLVALWMFAACDAMAQSPAPLGPTALLVFDPYPIVRSDFGATPAAPEQYRVVRKPDGHEAYVSTTGGPGFVFDPASFGFTFKLPGSAEQYKLDAGRSGNEMKYTIPARLGSVCGGDVRMAYAVGAPVDQVATVNVDGVPVIVKAVAVAMKGTWAHGACGSGGSLAQILYSPELKVILSLQWRTADAFPVGEKSVLKSITH